MVGTKLGLKACDGKALKLYYPFELITKNDYHFIKGQQVNYEKLQMAELKYTKHLLKKIEELFEEVGYSIRYAKGTFNSGYCIVENQKVAVINKFYETEGRVTVLMDIINQIEVKEDSLTEKSLKTYKQITKEISKEEKE